MKLVTIKSTLKLISINLFVLFLIIFGIETFFYTRDLIKRSQQRVALKKTLNGKLPVKVNNKIIFHPGVGHSHSISNFDERSEEVALRVEEERRY